jgi:imidazole glycerol-phosphate synthase subunit HisH
MIEIINTGVANIRSLQASFDRLGAAWRLTTDAHQILSGGHVVLPGVGAFGAAITELDRLGLRQPILQRIAAARPLLCICLGMQLLAESSEESPGVAGLGVISARIKRFSGQVPVPQLGWNQVQPVRGDRTSGREIADAGAWETKRSFKLNEFQKSRQGRAPDEDWPIEPGEAYFANSFCLIDPPDGWGYAVTEYDGQFLSSIWRGQLLACQFHPELSGSWGEHLIKRWIEKPFDEETCC